MSYCEKMCINTLADRLDEVAISRSLSLEHVQALEQEQSEHNLVQYERSLAFRMVLKPFWVRPEEGKGPDDPRCDILKSRCSLPPDGKQPREARPIASDSISSSPPKAKLEAHWHECRNIPHHARGETAYHHDRQ